MFYKAACALETLAVLDILLNVMSLLSNFGVCISDALQLCSCSGPYHMPDHACFTIEH